MLDFLFQVDNAYLPVLIAVAAIIIIGYIGRAIFQRTKIPEALILIGIGLLLVPVGHLLPGNYVNALRSIASVFGDIALVVIMYNGGKAITFDRALFQNRRGYILGFLDTLLSTVAIAIFMWFVFGWPIVYGALLGAILGETSTVIVIPLIRKIKISAEMYSSLVLETTLNSIFAILLFVFLLSFVNGQVLSVNAFANIVVDYMSVGVALGAIVGVLWIAMQNYVKGAREYLATLAVAILLFGVAGLFNGAGAISVLVFAIMLGNYKPIAKFFNFNIDMKKREIGERNAVERDIEFLIITFFFVFIGMIALISVEYFLYALIITMILIAIRHFEIKYVIDGDKVFSEMAFALMQRGTVVAVLAAILFSLGGFYFSQIFYICFMVIILTNIIASVLIARTELEVKKQA